MGQAIPLIVVQLLRMLLRVTQHKQAQLLVQLLTLSLDPQQAHQQPHNAAQHPAGQSQEALQQQNEREQLHHLPVRQGQRQLPQQRQRTHLVQVIIPAETPILLAWISFVQQRMILTGVASVLLD